MAPDTKPPPRPSPGVPEEGVERSAELLGISNRASGASSLAEIERPGDGLARPDKPTLPARAQLVEFFRQESVCSGSAWIYGMPIGIVCSVVRKIPGRLTIGTSTSNDGKALASGDDLVTPSPRKTVV